jgi:hypothetical protein
MSNGWLEFVQDVVVGPVVRIILGPCPRLAAHAVALVALFPERPRLMTERLEPFTL